MNLEQYDLSNLHDGGCFTLSLHLNFERISGRKKYSTFDNTNFTW